MASRSRRSGSIESCGAPPIHTTKDPFRSAGKSRLTGLQILRTVHDEGNGELMRGILYWKLSTHLEHEEIEPFVLHVGPDSEDELLPALLRFLDRGEPQTSVALDGTRRGLVRK